MGVRRRPGTSSGGRCRSPPPGDPTLITLSVQDKCVKGCVVLVTENKQNTFWRRLAEPPGQFPQIFMQVHTVVPHLYSRFHPNLFRFGGVITKKNPQSDFNMGSPLFEPMLR